MKEIEEEKKEPEKKGERMLELIVGKTYARHLGLSEEDYLKEIGFKDSGKSEDDAVRIAMFNVATEMAKEMVRAKGTLNMIVGIMKTFLTEKEKGELNDGREE